jgi:glycerol uptake facilitator-like aquaporin
MIGTAIFVGLILQIKYINAAKDDAVNAATVAITLFGMIQNIGGFTGGCLNPAVAISQGCLQHIAYNIDFMYLPCHLASTFLGGVLAGVLQILNLYAHKKVLDNKPSSTSEASEVETMLN